MDFERLVECPKRAVKVSLGGQDQPAASARAGLRPAAPRRSTLLLQTPQEPSCLVEFTNGYQRLDRIREHAVDARLSPPELLQSICNRPEVPISSRRVTEGKLDEAQHRCILRFEDLIVARLRGRQSLARRGSCLLDA